MIIAFTVVGLVISTLVIIVSLIMSPDSNGFSGALVGSGDLELFKYSKERGIKKVIKWSMLILGLLIFVISIVLNFLLIKG